MVDHTDGPAAPATRPRGRVRNGPFDVPGYAIGDCLDLMRAMEPDSVQMVVTSPPYWGLRDNGTGPGQLGMEPTPGEYVDRMVGIFREVRRVLRPDGVVFLNLGDCYIAHVNGNQDELRNPGLGPYGVQANRPESRAGDFVRNMASDIRMAPNRRPVAGLKNKDLVGIPWRVALALQADGWWLRRDIIWHIPNPSPESVTDRPARSHEYVFLLAKSERYFYDCEAVKEPVSGTANPRGTGINRKAREGVAHMSRQNSSYSAAITGLVATRNQRSVWRVPVQPYHGSHYAVYPPRLVEPCILAGSSPYACGICGAPWRREVEVYYEKHRDGGVHRFQRRRDGSGAPHRVVRRSRLSGWSPTCEHQDRSGRCVVFDPFLGSGTTAMVAERLGRHWLGFEQDARCEALIQERVRGVQLELTGLL